VNSRRLRGFTLVEVLVALMIVAIGLAALLVTVSGTARTSSYLRDKTLAQWIAMNRITEVRLSSGNKFAQNTDTAEVDFAGRTWHYDTQYFDTSIKTMKRVVVRVYAGETKVKGSPLAESISFLGSALGAAGGSNIDWTQGSTVATAQGAQGTTVKGGTQGNVSSGNALTPTPVTPNSATPTPTPVQP